MYHSPGQRGAIEPLGDDGEAVDSSKAVDSGQAVDSGDNSEVIHNFCDFLRDISYPILAQII